MADESKRGLPRVPSGVPGLDTILQGGFFETGVYLFEGQPGAGKTILANQVVFHQATLQRRCVYYTLLSESHDRMMRFLEGLSFYRSSAIPEWVTYVSGFKVLEAEGLSGLMANIRDTVCRAKASLLVIDGLRPAEEAAPSNLAFRKFLHELQTLSGMCRCTIFLLVNPVEMHQLTVEHTMAEGVLHLESSIVRLKPIRSIDVLKFRGASYLRGTHSLRITDDGIAVFPRLETLLAPGAKPPPDQLPRRGFGSPSIDSMMRGGLLSGSNTMVLGPSGAGKTTLALQFACGAPAGERALFFTFYEQPRELLARAKRLGLGGAAEACQRGDLCIEWQSSVEASVDKIGARLIDLYERLEPSRIVVDGIQGFQVTADPPERIQDFFAALSDFFASRGATILFTCESDQLFGATSIRVPFYNASRMCQNIVLMRFVEKDDGVHKVLSIVKMRDSDFDCSVRAVVFGAHGIEVAPAE